MQVDYFFTFKDKIPVFLCSSIVYKNMCGGCSANYCGRTKSHFKVGMCKQIGVSPLAVKTVKVDKDSAIKEFLDISQ